MSGAKAPAPFAYRYPLTRFDEQENRFTSYLFQLLSIRDKKIQAANTTANQCGRSPCRSV